MELVFTPKQKEEALSWYKKNTPEFISILTPTGNTNLSILENMIIDIYFKLKNLTVDLNPNQVVIGVEYNDIQQVIEGKEHVNIAIFNPHKGNVVSDTCTAILYKLMGELKE